jgi:TrmH family RNA methyltransferase
MLDMLQKKQTKYLRSLRLKKYRQQHQQYVAEGDKIVSEVLAAFPPELRLVVCTHRN